MSSETQDLGCILCKHDTSQGVHQRDPLEYTLLRCKCGGTPRAICLPDPDDMRVMIWKCAVCNVVFTLTPAEQATYSGKLPTVGTIDNN